MYHTQEKRANRLTGPLLCSRQDAWLGTAYYFWEDEVDAIAWGHNSKARTNSFEIYSATIDCEKILDTVFNEEHYIFWVKLIEKAAKQIFKKTGKKASINEINQYFIEKANWSELYNGILFQDLPNSNDLLVLKLYYRKRIQMAVYNPEIIHNFAFHFDMKCSNTPKQ